MSDVIGVNLWHWKCELNPQRKGLTGPFPTTETTNEELPMRDVTRLRVVVFMEVGEV